MVAKGFASVDITEVNLLPWAGRRLRSASLKATLVWVYAPGFNQKPMFSGSAWLEYSQPESLRYWTEKNENPYPQLLGQIPQFLVDRIQGFW